MKALALIVVALVGRFLLAGAPEPQPPMLHTQGPDERIVILDDHVREVLAHDWDQHAHDRVILERAYCVTFRRDVWYVASWIWRVTDIQPADSVEGQTPHSIQSFYCSEAPNVTTAHLHPDQSCITDTDCVHGGTLAYQCFPSDVDRASLRRSGKPFALLQCDRNAIISFGP